MPSRREGKTRIAWQHSICVQGKRKDDLAVYMRTWGDIFAGHLWHLVKWEMGCSHCPLRLSLGIGNADIAQRPAALEENLLLEIFCVVFNNSSCGFTTH